MLLTSALYGAAEGCYATIGAGKHEDSSWRRAEGICVATGSGDKASASLTQVHDFQNF
jgi:hypothetical protein